MTDKDKAIQESERIAAADEYFKARTWIMDTSDNRRIFEAGFDRAYALLSKLRAPVADERNGSLISFAVRLAEETVGERVTPKDYAAAGVFVAQERQARAALASAPVAAPSDETLRLAGVIADKIEDGTLFQAGIYSRRELADRVRAVVRSVRVASAPVAGEAHPVAWITDGFGPTKDPEIAQAWRSLGRDVRPLVYGDAAPQASEAVRLYIPPAKPLPDLMMASYHEAIGWNECRAAILQSAALSAQPGAQSTGGSDAE